MVTEPKSFENDFNVLIVTVFESARRGQPRKPSGLVPKFAILGKTLGKLV
jgi:hypothetical protein